MASPNDTRVEIRRVKLSKMLLNDSRAIFRRKQMRNQQKSIERSPVKTKEKQGARRRLLEKSEADSLVYRSTPNKFSQLNSRNMWKSEYDLLNMITHSIEKDLKDTDRNHWKGGQIGIATSDNRIQLIENLKEFNQHMVVDRNGNTIPMENVIQSHDILAENGLRINYKLVPVIESFSLVKNSVETEYKVCTENSDCNNNNQMASSAGSVTDQTSGIPSDDDKHDNTYWRENLAFLDNINFDDYSDHSDDVTMKPTEESQFDSYNSSCGTSENLDYSDFVNTMPTTASSTFILEESLDLFPSPPKRKTAEPGFKVHIDSPMPYNFEEMWCEQSLQSHLDLSAMIEDYRKAKVLYTQLGDHLKRVETKIKYLLQASLDENSSQYFRMDSLSVTGIGSVSDFSILV